MNPAGISDYVVCAIKMFTISYDKQTQNSANPIARHAHRNRLSRSLKLALARLTDGTLLDYGCGSGAFLSELEKSRPGQGIGYEPFMEERNDGAGGGRIFKNITEASEHGPFQIITLFETLEHLIPEELKEFLDFSQNHLTPAGGILISAPIEIGPTVILKELNRARKFRRPPELNLAELLKAVFLAKAPPRAEDIKVSHKGFDFREAMKRLRKMGWKVEVLGYGPLPLGTWVGNSQVYLWCCRMD